VDLLTPEALQQKPALWANVQEDLVWRILQDELPPLRRRVEQIAREVSR